MGVPNYNNIVRHDDWPKPGQPFSTRFTSNYAEKVQQDFALLNGGLSLGSNMNGAIVTMSMTHGIPVLVASPLRNKARPIGVLALACDTQSIPNITMTTSAVVNGITTTLSDGNLWVTANYPVIANSQITDWVSYTPSGSWTTNTTYSGMMRRIGDTLEAQVKLTLSGAPNAISLTAVNIPNNLTIDGSKLLVGSGTANSIGQGAAKIAGVASYYVSVIDNSGATGSVRPVVLTGTGYASSSVGNLGISNTVPGTWANGDEMTFVYRVPISGWSIISNGTSTNANVTIYFAGA